jgi:CPA1 family monovalent cation:H+ antiporter
VASRGEPFGWPQAIGAFVLSYLGGATAGLVVAWLTVRARALMRDPLLENMVNVLAPFAAFLLAEQIHASGVLAVVVCGLALSQINPRVMPARTRVPIRAFLQLTAFMLNGALFVLIGLQLRGAVEDLVSYSLAAAVAQALLISAVVIGTRLLWSYTTPYVVRAVDRRPQQRLRRIGARQRLPVAWAGFRGGVSLAAALAVPAAMPGRDLIVIVTFGVILVTTVVQGLTLPAVLRWSRLPEDGSELDEQRMAERAMAEAALAALPTEAARLGVSDEVVERMQSELEQRLAELDSADTSARGASSLEPEDRSPRIQQKLLHKALLAEKRATLVRLRDTRLIDDIVLRRLQARLDAEEMRYAAWKTESD